VRYRKKLEDERIRLVDRQMKMDPNFKPPTEYLMAKRQNGGRPMDKVFIPVKEFPEINFFGLLVGPRGNSLKNMERESGAKISIRGKGSVKEGKGRTGKQFEDDENEELHCLITAETEEKVQRCVKLINSVIEIVSTSLRLILDSLTDELPPSQAASVPEGQNDHKRNQLRELAQLNGTLRDDENQVCQYVPCFPSTRRISLTSFPLAGTVEVLVTASTTVPSRRTGLLVSSVERVEVVSSSPLLPDLSTDSSPFAAGHMARDCTQGRGHPGAPGFGPPGAMPGAPVDQARAQQFDSEYASLMAELGETSATAPVAGNPSDPAGGAAPWNGAVPAAGPRLDENGEKIPPWREASNW
jgi:splicing factor 1